MEFHIQPTVVAEVSDAMLLAREETFGPVAPLMRFATEAEVLSRANATELGLAGYVLTRDYACVLRMAERLECGMVGVNTGLFSTEVVPFAGVTSPAWVARVRDTASRII